MDSVAAAMGQADVPSGPATHFESVAVGDPLPSGTRGIYIQQSGTYEFTNALEVDVAFICFAGQILPIVPMGYVSGPVAVIALR